MGSMGNLKVRNLCRFRRCKVWTSGNDRGKLSLLRKVFVWEKMKKYPLLVAMTTFFLKCCQLRSFFCFRNWSRLFVTMDLHEHQRAPIKIFPNDQNSKQMRALGHHETKGQRAPIMIRTPQFRLENVLILISFRKFTTLLRCNPVVGREWDHLDLDGLQS